MEGLYWVRLEGLWPVRDEDRKVYDIVLDEVRNDLKRGTIMLAGRPCHEGRLTAMYSNVEAIMKYSGRTLNPIRPKENGYLSMMLDLINDNEFREAVYEDCPEIRGLLPDFNAVFVNWYRPPELCEAHQMDSIGAHSDDTRGLTSEVIFSVTFCEQGGERLFSFYDKSQNDKMIWQEELKDGDVLIMLNGCQRRYKHGISPRKTHLDKTKITGGRINFTFRCMKLN